jgi:hypothetical protein
MRLAKSLWGIVVPVMSICVVGACTGESKHSSSSSSSTATKAEQLGGGNSKSTECTNGSAPGCPCTAGSTIACWTGPTEDRNVGACHDGTQTCQSSGEGEQSTWGACQGEQLECGVGAPDAAPDVADASDAGKTDAATGFLVSQNATAGGGVSPCSVVCTGCVPGAVIGCYDDCNLMDYCDTTATETCLPNGTWGPCTETGGGGGGGGLPPSGGGIDGDASPSPSDGGPVSCYEFWGNCSNYNGGAGSYAGQCDSVFTGCASQFSTTCPGSSDTSQLGAGAPDIPDAGMDDASSGTSACETAGYYCLPAAEASNCATSGGMLTSDSCTGSASGGTACCDFEYSEGTP